MEETLEQNACDCIRVVFFGPESTGKTTLARTMAERYATRWAPEFMRDYLQEKWDRTGQKSTPEDLIPIAIGQMDLENRNAAEANSYLFCDTNLLELLVYSEYYFNGFCPEAIRKYATEHQYDHYFLTNIDIPWESDALRDRPDDREEIFAIFEKELIKRNIPYTVLNGDLDERIRQVEAVLNSRS